MESKKWSNHCTAKKRHQRPASKKRQTRHELPEMVHLQTLKHCLTTGQVAKGNTMHITTKQQVKNSKPWPIPPKKESERQRKLGPQVCHLTSVQFQCFGTCDFIILYVSSTTLIRHWGKHTCYMSQDSIKIIIFWGDFSLPWPRPEKEKFHERPEMVEWDQFKFRRWIGGAGCSSGVMGNLITVYSTLCCALPWLTALEQAEADGDKLDFLVLTGDINPALIQLSVLGLKHVSCIFLDLPPLGFTNSVLSNLKGMTVSNAERSCLSEWLRWRRYSYVKKQLSILSRH